jgi:hypothetical protein
MDGTRVMLIKSVFGKLDYDLQIPNLAQGEAEIGREQADVAPGADLVGQGLLQLGDSLPKISPEVERVDVDGESLSNT